MTQDGDMPARDFKAIQKALKTRRVAAPCPACGAAFEKRAVLSNYVALRFSAARDEDTDEAGASFAAAVCTHCGHVWLFHPDTLTGES